MKNKELILLLLLFVGYSANAMEKISVKDLCKLFEKDNNVYLSFSESIYNRYYIDFVECQKNAKVRNFLARLLDVNEYVAYCMDCYEKEGGLRADLRSILDYKCKRSYVDSVYRTPSLLQHYSDSLRNERKLRAFNSFYSGNLSHVSFTYSYIENIFVNIRCSEVYQMIKKSLKYGNNSLWLRKILRILQDPEEWSRYMNEVKTKAEQSELSKTDIRKIIQENMYAYKYGSFSITFAMLMLDCKMTTEFNTQCFDWNMKEVPCAIGILCENNIVSDFLFGSEDLDIKRVFKSLLGENSRVPYSYFCYTIPYRFPICGMSYEELEKISEDIIKNKEHFFKALQPLIERLDQENYYWRSQMPYSK